MSPYTTKEISRQEAENMVIRCRMKLYDIKNMTDKELGDELHSYVYSGKHEDVVGCLYNYLIK